METRIGDYQLEAATNFGPRITGLRLGDGPQLLAVLNPDVSIEYPGGVFRFHGGHRLWVSPEEPAVTYASDEHQCEITREDGTFTVSGPRDIAGVVKEISVTARNSGLVVQHRLAMQARSVAPWAITQLPLGGTAIIPFTGDDTGPLPNRHIVTWPYTSLADERITLGNDHIEIRATAGPPLKLGTGLQTRRLGYFRNGYVFIKESGATAGWNQPDIGAARQVYVGQRFCELETVDSLRDLQDGESAHLTEQWWVRECDSLEEATALVMEG